MKIKVCGMREAGNLAAIAGLDPDLLGFIFYEQSARYVGDTLDPHQVRALPAGIRRVGVFVDAPLATVQATACRFGLDYVQLHGHESPDYCRRVRALGLRVIKAFGVGPGFDFAVTAAYAPVCDLFLFDTNGAQPGGNGTAFDWQVLRNYHGTTPFLLAGGLGLGNLADLTHLTHPCLYGFDFNSQLEAAPGLKDVARTRRLLTALHRQAA